MKTYLFLGLMIALYAVSAIAQIALPPDATLEFDWVKFIGELISNPKALKGVFIGFVVVLAIVQFLKSSFANKIFKNLDPKVQFALITILGQIYALAYKLLIDKSDDVSTVIIGFISSGGAVAIFNAAKLLLPQKKKEPLLPSL
jgi:hypothetical protein